MHIGDRVRGFTPFESRNAFLRDIVTNYVLRWWDSRIEPIDLNEDRISLSLYTDRQTAGAWVAAMNEGCARNWNQLIDSAIADYLFRQRAIADTIAQRMILTKECLRRHAPLFEFRNLYL